MITAGGLRQRLSAMLSVALIALFDVLNFGEHVSYDSVLSPAFLLF